MLLQSQHENRLLPEWHPRSRPHQPSLASGGHQRPIRCHCHRSAACKRREWHWKGPCRTMVNIAWGHRVTYQMGWEYDHNQRMEGFDDRLMANNNVPCQPLSSPLLLFRITWMHPSDIIHVDDKSRLFPFQHGSNLFYVRCKGSSRLNMNAWVSETMLASVSPIADSHSYFISCIFLLDALL